MGTCHNPQLCIKYGWYCMLQLISERTAKTDAIPNGKHLTSDGTRGDIFDFLQGQILLCTCCEESLWKDVASHQPVVACLAPF